MAVDPISSRYAHALFDAAKVEGQLEPVLAHLTFIGALLREHADLRQFLWNPDVDPQEKVGLLERALRGTWPPLVKAFVAMVVRLERCELLGQMAEALQAEVDRDQGRVRVLVRSAHPLSEAVLTQLRHALERRERKTIELEAQLAPELIGGMQLILGHRLIDGSARRQLDELWQQLTTARVH